MNENVVLGATQLLPVDVVQPGDVQPGDVLLMRGRGELSTLIAWVCNGIYSHSSVMAGDGQLYESITHGTVSTPLASRLGDDSPVYLIDVYRPLARDGNPLSPEDRQRVVAHGAGLLGLPYATNELALIGLVVALRGKIFPDAPLWLRWVLREAFDMVLKADSHQMTCSEFVYRCFAENDAIPAGRLAPEIVVAPPPEPPLPYTGNVGALLEEIWKLLRPQRKQKLQQGVELQGRELAAPPVGMELEAMIGAVAEEELAEEKLAAAAQAVRAHIGASEPKGKAFGAIEAVLPFAETNPKGVSPVDLAITPSHRPLGRLMQAPDWTGG